MSDISSEMRTEIDCNFKAMSEKINEYSQIYENKYALMRNGDVIEFYVHWEDAYKTGAKFFDDGLFSVQQVRKTPVDLGYFSHAVHIG